jgi:hypothetical protein
MNTNNSAKPNYQTKILIRELITFTIKLIILLVFFSAFISTTFKNLIPETERNKIFLASFIQNPYALHRLSEIAENSGDIDKAIVYMEFALSLVDLHCNSSKQYIIFEKRLKDLMKKKQIR